MLKRISVVTIILSLFIYNCSNANGTRFKISREIDTTLKGYDSVLQAREKLASEKNTDNLGELIIKIDFQVKTDNLTDFEGGYIPWVELGNPNKDLRKLKDKDEIVISENKVTVIIDYPLTNSFTFELISEKGFTREQLVKEISKNYHKIYSEEESTSTDKTAPMKKRTTLYNRNQTNGKYGIWGHDLNDLALDNIEVYKSAKGDIILSLDIDS